MDVTNARLGLVQRVHHIFLYRYPRTSRVGEGVFRDGVQITRADQLAQVLRSFVFVLGKLTDGVTHSVQILFQDCLARTQNVGPVTGNRNTDQDEDDGNDDDHFDQREAVLPTP